MTSADRQRLAAAVERVLAPLAAHAKTAGLGQRDFATLATRAFRRGTPTAAFGAAFGAAVAIRVVGRWLTDPAYLRRGTPHRLARTGPGSFAALVRSARGGSAEKLLANLQRAGVVTVDRQGRLRLLQKGFIPTAASDAKIDFLGTAGADFLRVILHNLTAAPPDSFLQRAASYDNIGASSVAMLRSTLRREGERALLRANALLASRDRDRNPSAAGGRRTRVAFGVYYFEEPVGPPGGTRGKR